jgi:hypothetical protein
MSTWLQPLREALDRRDTPISVFFRDDDAGWRDDLLDLLLEPFAEHGVPIDLAVIPDATDADCAANLRRWTARGPIRLHQHGRAHTNHQRFGRKCEFGDERSVEAIRADVIAGATRLRGLLGELIDPIFTPPWNRCTVETAEALPEAGHRVLSRESSAAPLGLADICEIPVTFDWFAKAVAPDRGAALQHQLSGAGPVGIMLHHAVTGDEDRHIIGELVEFIGAHPMTEPTSILQLAVSASRA